MVTCRFYAAAAIANASHHPRLAALLKQNGGDTIDMMANVHYVECVIDFS